MFCMYVSVWLIATGLSCTAPADFERLPEISAFDLSPDHVDLERPPIFRDSPSMLDCLQAVVAKKTWPRYISAQDKQFRLSSLRLCEYLKTEWQRVTQSDEAVIPQDIVEKYNYDDWLNRTRPNFVLDNAAGKTRKYKHREDKWIKHKFNFGLGKRDNSHRFYIRLTTRNYQDAIPANTQHV